MRRMGSYVTVLSVTKLAALSTLAAVMMPAAVLLGCGGADTEGEPASQPTSGAEADTAVEVVGPEEGAQGGADAQQTAAAVANMQPTEGNDVNGTVRFVQQGRTVQVDIDLVGFEPGTRHGFHVHENGDCSAPDGTSAGGHYNPTDVDHALPEDMPRHAGDMGNIEADEAGEVHTQLTFETFSVQDVDPPPIAGRGLIVHADPDDGSQPTGGAGDRIACGVIEVQ